LQFKEGEFLLRSRAMHNKHCEELSGPASLQDHHATTNGVVRNSCLNTSKFFHVINGMAPDIMHDILEGVLQVFLIATLKDIILKNLILPFKP